MAETGMLLHELQRFRRRIETRFLAMIAVAAFVGGLATIASACGDSGSQENTEPAGTSQAATPLFTTVTQAPTPTELATQEPTEAPTPEPTPMVEPLDLLNRTIAFFEGPAPANSSGPWELKQFNVLEGTEEEPGGTFGFYDMRLALAANDNAAACEMLSVGLFTKATLLVDPPDDIILSEEEIQAIDPDRLMIPTSWAVAVWNVVADSVARDLVALKYALCA